MQLLMGLIGIIVLILIGVIFSSHRKSIKIRAVFGAFAIQAAIGAFVMLTTNGANVLKFISSIVQKVIQSADVGINFVFGALTSDKMIHIFGNTGFIFAFKVLPMIIFFGAFMSVLYYIGIMQIVIRIFGGGLQKALGTSRTESLAASANIFLGQTEAPLVVKPFIKGLTHSELFAIMAGGLASISGAVLAGYAEMGVSLNYLIAASFMAAPGGLLMAKLLEPETEKPRDKLEKFPKKEEDNLEIDEDKPTNIIHAAANGAADGLHLALNIGAMLIAFIALIALVNMLLSEAGGLFGFHALTLQEILGYLFAPIAFILGIPWHEAAVAGSILGQKIVLNEFVAYVDFMGIKATLTPHTQVILTIALCGFANFSSIAVLLGGLGIMAPARRAEIARMGLKAVLAGTLSNFMSATLMGIFYLIHVA